MSSELNSKLNRDQSSQSPVINSTQVALLISLGFHLLLYKYGLPTLFVQKNNTVSSSKNVTTIELNPLEQARLPDLESEFIIPEFNNTPLDGDVPPLALPTYITPDIGNLADLPTIPVPLLPNFDNLPSYSTDISLPPIVDLSSLPEPPTLEDLDLESLDEPPVRVVEESPEEPEPFPEKPENPVAGNEPPTENPEVSQEKQPTPEEIAAVRQQKLQDNLGDISNSLQKQDGGNSDEDARKNYVSWISKIEEIQPEVVAIAGIYPKDACIRRLEGTTVYGVVVDSSNQVVDSKLLKSADYPVFNQQAIKDITAYNFGNNTTETKPYQVTVDYQYNSEICPSLTLPSLRKETETTKPETNPTETESEVPEIETPVEVEPTTTEENVQPITSPEENNQPLDSDDSLRERLENTPLPDDESLKERLENSPLNDDDNPTPNGSLRERLKNAPLTDDDSLRERLQNAPLPEN